MPAYPLKPGHCAGLHPFPWSPARANTDTAGAERPCPLREATIDVIVTIGADPEITVSISDDDGWSPDQLDDACRRAGNEALRLHHALHPAEADG